MKSLYTIFLTALILIACSADKSAPENNKYKGTWEFTLPDSDDKGALSVRDRLLLDEDKWILDRTVNATLANEYFEVHVTFRGFIGTKSKITHDDGSVSVELELERARIDDYKYHFPSLEPRISIVASLDRWIIETGLNSNDPDFIFRATLHSPESDSGQLIDLKPDTGYLEYLHTDYSSGEYQLIHMNLPNAPLYKLSQDTNDRDGDGVPNEQDAFPDDFWFQSDLDGDGIGDYDDPDIDGDGRLNKEDAFPSDPNEVNDFDRDGIGDNADTD
ncbi:MAG: thrombospondin type 3 repeat-containing protein, partial [Pseudomonadales bacterium]|nr:thrombospondin type 3 repeat-containing protein [Pseudomonadales bacterium]